ncbi:hypothetical protein LEP1GSC132_2709 [Leptospira kirschneri str. 200803703]|uniref:Uncharacterized protein n=1 Tax=Leptospira kirschneri str. H1 TaxID=1049966 RepID=A0A0E2B2R6_9LEPT|nr:hypothetical protein LEP1GSC044_3152 [Leptospira kirschneri serovar Grippotyphosa str. RM52]EKO15434.1 hypothetical protein LEP1GSC081_1215 [Leptospira kirschneri str. H1]EKP05902.1 hypothetical protein LEP1GSC018_2166 [Leptospira kirschneri str. 2008720114]EKQ83428.1 hypothetical protein LEP1GSC064_2463 [Leptospira kirschneri serovar Grippotyphosa str. Moskva]EKR09081.1 hypothetical protein LEP1GSC122_0577 [Leptospira kirschneri serovar Valbuzzi str. 200702274]EMK07023.1 hypothetical prote
MAAYGRPDSLRFSYAKLALYLVLKRFLIYSRMFFNFFFY